LKSQQSGVWFTRVHWKKFRKGTAFMRLSTILDDNYVAPRVPPTISSRWATGHPPALRPHVLMCPQADGKTQNWRAPAAHETRKYGGGKRSTRVRVNKSHCSVCALSNRYLQLVHFTVHSPSSASASRPPSASASRPPQPPCLTPPLEGLQLRGVGAGVPCPPPIPRRRTNPLQEVASR